MSKDRVLVKMLKKAYEDGYQDARDSTPFFGGPPSHPTLVTGYFERLILNHNFAPDSAGSNVYLVHHPFSGDWDVVFAETPAAADELVHTNSRFPGFWDVWGEVGEEFSRLMKTIEKLEKRYENSVRRNDEQQEVYEEELAWYNRELALVEEETTR